jgi:phosphate butyryltransferase
LIKSFTEIERRVATTSGDPQVYACVEPHESSLLAALARAVEKDLIKPVLIGSEDRISTAADQADVDIKGWELVRSGEPNESVYLALDLVRNGKVSGLVKGVFGIWDFLSLVLERKQGFRDGKNRVSGIMACKVADLDRMVFVSDPIVTPHPELPDLIDIVNNSAGFVHRLGYEKPKVAMLAAVEVIYPQMAATIAGAVIAKMSERGQIKGSVVDGPLSMDVALRESAAHEKGVTGDVAGKADVLIGHNLAVNYGVAKAFAMYTRSEYGYVIVGGRVPAVITSADDPSDAKFNSLLLSLAGGSR